MALAIKITLNGHISRMYPAEEARSIVEMQPEITEQREIPAVLADDGSILIPADTISVITQARVTRPETDEEFYRRIAEKDCPEGAAWDVIEENDFPPLPPPSAPPAPTREELKAQLDALALTIARLP